MMSTEEPKRMKKSRLLWGNRESRNRLPSTFGLSTFCISSKVMLASNVSLRTIAAFATPAIGGSVSEIVLTVADNESRSEISLRWWVS